MPSSSNPNVCGSAGCSGAIAAVTYQVDGQDGNPMPVEGMTPLESVVVISAPPGGAQAIDTFQPIGPTAYPGTSLQTNSLGQFTDAPVGLLFNNAGPIKSGIIIQSITISSNGMNYPVGTMYYFSTPTSLTGSNGVTLGP